MCEIEIELSGAFIMVLIIIHTTSALQQGCFIDGITDPGAFQSHFRLDAKIQLLLAM